MVKLKKITTKIVETLPDILKNTTDWLKNNFDENAQDILGDATGTVGIIIKLLGKNAIDNYFIKINKEKLKNYGELTYLQAGFSQACKSIELIEKDLNNNLNINELQTHFNTINQIKLDKFKKEDLVLVFQPEYHPAIIFVKEYFIDLLQALKVEQRLLNRFKLDYNKNITHEVEVTFGESFSDHIGQISDFLLEHNETKLLMHNVQLGRIGFDQNEDLKYEETYANWVDLSKLKIFKEEEKETENNVKDVKEESLRSIEFLIDEYFNNNPKNNLDKILFIVADFGKGKSVFLKHFAAELSKKYLSAQEGMFPIYFNLRNFHNYSHNTRLGVIEDYLLTNFGIDIKSTYYEKKNFIFLIDSLDESGELNKISIEKVISSIKQIQNINKEKYRTNKIIITTRPFDDGLDSQIRNHQPKTRTNKEGREIVQYLSIYGFKKKQFNDWILSTIKNVPREFIYHSSTCCPKRLNILMIQIMM